MEFYAVQAVEGLVKRGKGPKKGSLAGPRKFGRKIQIFSDQLAKRPAHMDTHGPELIHVGKQQFSRGTMSRAEATCKVCHVSRALHVCHACSKSMLERGKSCSPRSPGSHGSHHYAHHPHTFIAGAASSET